MSGPRKPPHSARVLSQWVDAYAREQGLAPKRVRDWISYMILGGRLEQVGTSANGPRFTIKGAVALEMRLPSRARATKDIDLVAVRAACVEVFALRGTHGWPPVLDPPAFWKELYAQLAEDLVLPERSLEDAVSEAQAFIEATDAAPAQ